MTPEARDALQALIEETWRWLGFHKRRGAVGRIEALACHIRLNALREARAVIEKAEKDHDEKGGV